MQIAEILIWQIFGFKGEISGLVYAGLDWIKLSTKFLN